MKLPSFQFYPGDWRKDPGVQSLSYHDRGVWFEMLCLLFESEDRGRLMLNGQSMPEDALARLLGLDKQVLTKTLTSLLDYGVASRCPITGALMSRRMVRDEQIRKLRVEAGKKGGNPALLNQKPNHPTTTQDNQKPTPSSSASPSLTLSLNARQDEQDDEPSAEPGVAPLLEQWTRAMVPYGVPEWYAVEKWKAWNAKNWHSGRTPIIWKRVLEWVKRDYEQAGRPAKPEGNSNAKHQPNSRIVGTRNEGTATQYAGVGRVDTGSGVTAGT